MIPYAVASPDYDHTSGGIKVMWGLFGHLLARGYEVYMNRYPSDRPFIGIYPETIGENIMGAQKVVRYILNKPGIMGVGEDVNNLKAGPTEFDEGDELFYFSRLFGEADDDHYMFLPIINTDIFKDYGKKRPKKALFVGKGDDLGKHPDGCTIIDRDVAANQQDLADLLNECQVIYQYDFVSAMSEIARLCGCRIVYLSDKYTKEEYALYEPGINGMSFGSDTGEKLDSGAFRATYMGLKDTFEHQLDIFIERTQQ